MNSIRMLCNRYYYMLYIILFYVDRGIPEQKHSQDACKRNVARPLLCIPSLSSCNLWNYVYHEHARIYAPCCEHKA